MKVGKVIFLVGKNSFICKSSTTFLVLVSPAWYLTGVSHVDAGQIQKKDILIIISNSGNTSELTNL